MKVVTGAGGDLSKVPDQARRAEELGYDAVTTGETQHDSILIMTLAAEHTRRVEVCTSVTIAFPRSPMVLAMEAWDLQKFSGGRINIGLGSQVKGHIQRRFGMPWSAPAPRMRDYIRMMRAVWDSWQNGTKPNFVSDDYTYTLMTPFFNPGPIDAPFPKVSISAVNPVMASVAGEVADGLLPHGFATTKYLLDVIVPAVRRGAQRAGRSMDEIEISAGGFMVIGETDSEVEQGLERLRQPISFYGSTRSYHGVFRAHGREDLGMQLHEMSLKGQWEEMRRVIPEEVLHEFAMKATYDTLPEVLRKERWYASRVSLNLPVESPEQRERLRWLMNEIHAIPAPNWDAVPA
ncbi:MAG: TIGR03617 family F420-dependent LLM class oxidoreductase [Dehalococcoidia bacterium]